MDSLPNDDAFNAFCDDDANWGPLLFLRPDRSERIGPVRALAGAVLLGLPLGLLGGILMSLFARALSQPVPGVALFPFALVLGYWAVGQLTLVRAWNRRAERLARLADWA